MKIYKILLLFLFLCLMHCGEKDSGLTLQEQLEPQSDQSSITEQLNKQIARTDSLEQVFEDKKKELDDLARRVQDQENKQVTPL